MQELLSGLPDLKEKEAPEVSNTTSMFSEIDSARTGIATSPETEESLLKNWNLGIVQTLGLLGGAVKNIALGGGTLNLAREIRGENVPLLSDIAETTNDLQEFASEYGVVPEPGREGKGFGARTAQIAGGSILPYLGTAVKGASLVKAGAEAIKGTGLLDRMALTLAKKPISSLGLEATSISAASGAGYVAREKFNVDNEWGIALSEMAGGLSPVALRALPMATTIGYKTYRKFLKPSFTRAGGEVSASKQLISKIDDLPLARERLAGADTISGVGLTPVAKIRDFDIYTLEKSVLDANHELRGIQQGRMSETIKSLKEITKGLDPNDIPDEIFDINDTTKFLELERGYLKELVDVRFEVATAALDQELSRIMPKDGSRPDQAMRNASKAAENKLMGAVKDVRKQETVIWRALPDSIKGDLSSTKYNGHVDQDGRRIDGFLTEVENFDPAVQNFKKTYPKLLIELFGRYDKKGKYIKGIMPDDPTAKQIHIARSRVGEELAKERGKISSSRNKVRLLSNSYGSLLKDLESIKDAGIEYKRAIAFSKDLNDRFTKGTMARILGVDTTGAERVPSENTLDLFVGKRGIERDLDQFIAAVPSAGSDVEDYIYSAFLEQVPVEGKITPASYRRFIKRNNVYLDRFPDVRKQLGTINNARNLVSKYITKQKFVTDNYYSSKSRMGMFLDAKQEREIASIFSERTKSPAVLARYIKKKVVKDRTGKALKGLKYSIGEFIINKIDKLDPYGRSIPDSNQMKLFLTDRRNLSALQEIYTPKELQRLEYVANSFEGVTAELTGYGKPDQPISTDVPSRMLDFVTSMMAVRIASKTTQGIGPGGLVIAGKTSSTANKLAKKFVATQPQRVLSEVITDQKLFEALIADLSDPKEAEMAYRRLNAWILGVATTQNSEERQ